MSCLITSGPRTPCIRPFLDSLIEGLKNRPLTFWGLNPGPWTLFFLLLGLSPGFQVSDPAADQLSRMAGKIYAQVHILLKNAVYDPFPLPFSKGKSNAVTDFQFRRAHRFLHILGLAESHAPYTFRPGGAARVQRVGR